MINGSKFARLIERQRESGLTVRSFCSNEGIAPSTFYYWQKKIRNEAGEKRFIPLVVKSPGAAFNPVTQRESAEGQKGDGFLLEITYPNGITLRIKNDLDLARLRALIALLD
jgi:transposase-like protein